MRKNILSLLGLAAAMVFTGCDSREPEAHSPCYQEISANIDSGQTKTIMSEIPDSYNMMTKWQGFEIVKVFRKSLGGIYHEKVVDVKVSDLTSDGTGAKFKYEVPQEWLHGFDSEYEVKCFTMSSHPVEKDDMLYFNASLVRRRLADFQVPVYWTGVAGTDDNVLSATFGHYYTYELLHIRNSSSSSINFSLVGFQGSKQWYKEKGSLCLEDGSFITDGPSTQDPVRESDPFAIPAGGSDIVVSAYIPNGFKIQDATLYAQINGESVHSINKKSSDVTLQTGHAYHMYAEWDGKNLRFLDGPFEDEMSEYVDLGLPSGLKWASCNLGASKPEEYGGYYQWAGTQDVTDTGIYLDWSNCPYHTGSNSSTGWTKYMPSEESSYWSGPGGPDNKTVLDPEDDVAHVKLGGKWRMPTIDEFGELIGNCTAVWTTLNGVYGRKFTSKKNGNSIFLPTAGFREFDRLSAVGYYGFYWSSSLGMNFPYYAYELNFGEYYALMRSDIERFYGHSVRPVYGEGISGKAVISVSPEEVEFGKVYPGESATASFTITNTGTATAYVSITNPSDFVTSDVSGDISISGAGGSKTVTLTFTPKEKGSYGGRILVSCGGTNINVLYEGTCIERNNDTPEAVDLGLPSGLKWASCNLGASKPEEYGGYYQWAGLEDVTSTSIYLNYSNCPYHTGSSYTTGWTKYIHSGQSSYWSGAGSPDNKTDLDLEDDVAHVKLGGKWRMPTVHELYELRDNCTDEWTTMNGVNGIKLISKTNGNSIFLPAAGYRDLIDICDAGSVGYYWTSELYSFVYPQKAHRLAFYSYGYFPYDWCDRYVGQPVRPVLE